VCGDRRLRGIDYWIAEFFVLRKFRRRGAGQRSAHQLFDRFRGRWLVAVLTLNTPAMKFWPKVIRRYTLNRFQRRRQVTTRKEKVTAFLFRNAGRPIPRRRPRENSSARSGR
jgi:predicted acetyltransferase